MPAPRIAIVGAPNVGKSTLFNRLVRRRRSLVADEPGLTRDLIEASIPLGGGRVTLVDTGGLMPAGASPLAGTILERVLGAARESDLLILLVDARAGCTAQDEDLARLFRESGRPILFVVNKVDGPDAESAVAPFARLGFDSPVPISAEHGLGIAELHDAVRQLVPRGDEEPERGEEIRIAIAGRPNVGKSSLLNAFLRQARALVSDQPGTTRDPVEGRLERGGRVYRLVDTAGIRRRGKVRRGAEALSVGAARRSVREADVTLVLLDAAEGIVAQDLHVLGVVAGGEAGWRRPAVILLNKTDLLDSEEAIRARTGQIRERVLFARYAPILAISATKHPRVGAILASVEKVHRQSTTFVATHRLNRWLREAVARHRPPLQAGREVSFVFISQAAAQPPTFTILTNRAVQPHFSYARYLENSLRERFDLGLTPLILRFRRRRPLGGGERRRRRRP